MLGSIVWRSFLVFIVTIVLIIVTLYIFAEPLIKWGIEKEGGKYLGAEVNVEKVALTYTPFTVELFNIQATDAYKPSHNVVSASSAKAGVDIWQYLAGKTIIDELKVIGIEFDGERQSVGEVYKYIDPKDASEKKDVFAAMQASLQQQLPDPKDLLNSVDLKTVKRAAALEQSYANEKQKFKTLKEQLPTKDTLADYKAKVKELSKSKVESLEDLEQLKVKYETLKDKFKADQTTVKQAKEQVVNAKTVLSEQLVALKNAPKEDWQDISTKYQLDQLNAEDFAHILFGDQARFYTQYVEMAFKYLKPSIATSTEQDTADIDVVKETNKGFLFFKADPNLPDLLLKKAIIEMTVAKGTFRLSIDELTNQHWYRNLPTKVAINTIQLGNSGDINLESNFAISQDKVMNGNGNWSIQKLPLGSLSLRKTKDVSLSIEKSILGLEGKFNVDKNELNSTSNIALTQNVYQGEANTHLGKILVDTIMGMDSLSLKVKANGPVLSPKLSLSSPLDKALKNAFQQQIKDKLASFQQDLQAGLNTKLNKALSLGDDQQSELINLESLLSDSDKQLDELINMDIVEQQKDKLKDKAKDKLKDKLGKIFG